MDYNGRKIGKFGRKESGFLKLALIIGSCSFLAFLKRDTMINREASTNKAEHLNRRALILKRRRQCGLSVTTDNKQHSAYSFLLSTIFMYIQFLANLLTTSRSMCHSVSFRSFNIILKLLHYNFSVGPRTHLYLADMYFHDKLLRQSRSFGCNAGRIADSETEQRNYPVGVFNSLTTSCKLLRSPPM